MSSQAQCIRIPQKNAFCRYRHKKTHPLLKTLKMYDSESFAEFLDKKIYSMYYKVDVVHVHIFKSNYAFQDSHT